LSIVTSAFRQQCTRLCWARPPRVATSTKPFADDMLMFESLVCWQRRPAWKVHASPSTEEERHGTHTSSVAGRQPDYRLHQSRRDCQVLPRRESAASVATDQSR